jgi:hypothetical protein
MIPKYYCHAGLDPASRKPWIPAYEAVSQFKKREKRRVWGNGFTPNFSKKFIIGNFNSPLFSTK